MLRYLRIFFIVAVTLVVSATDCEKDPPVPIRVSRLAAEWIVASGDCIIRAVEARFPVVSKGEAEEFEVSCIPVGDGLWTVSGTRTLKRTLDQGVFKTNSAVMTTKFRAVVSKSELLGGNAFSSSSFVVEHFEDNGLSARVSNSGQVNYPKPGKPDGRFFISVFDGPQEFERYEIVLEGGSVIYDNLDISH